MDFLHLAWLPKILPINNCFGKKLCECIARFDQSLLVDPSCDEQQEAH